MILSDQDIRSLICSEQLKVMPWEDHLLQPASVDLELSDHFLVMETNEQAHLTLDSKPQYREISSSSICIQPHQFVLASTRQFVQLPDHVTAFVEGRSSIGRLGLFIQNAGWVDPGFYGQVTLEIYNANSLPIVLEAGRRICQIVLCRMQQSAEKPYQGKYLGQKGAVGSLIFLDKEMKEQKNN